MYDRTKIELWSYKSRPLTVDRSYFIESHGDLSIFLKVGQKMYGRVRELA